MTLAPKLENSRADARPMPELAPVIRATLPSSSFSIETSGISQALNGGVCGSATAFLFEHALVQQRLVLSVTVAKQLLEHVLGTFAQLRGGPSNRHRCS